MFQKLITISGNIVDVLNQKVYPGTLEIGSGKIVRIIPNDEQMNTYILPGFVDAHIHIESSMMVPTEFARTVVGNGTVAVVADPHEIANVLGIDGVRYMIKNGRQVPFKFYFGVPSCVPATPFETSGAAIDLHQTELLFQKDKLTFLSEMMNFPGVLSDEPEVLAKIKVAQKYGRIIDGHAPGLRGRELQKYISAQICTDHEAYRYEEGLEKIEAGMKILIREGTAAKNFMALHRLIDKYGDQIMFCSDDKHPNDLIQGHLNTLVKKALQLGHDRFKVLKCATVNPVIHYQLDVGLLRPGDPADFIIIDDFQNFNILATYIRGQKVAENKECLIPRVNPKLVNNFKVKPKRPEDFIVKAQTGKIKVIEAIDGEIITGRLVLEPKIINGEVVSDPERDILKIVVVNRYREELPAVAFIRNFGLKKGAIASSVAHDSHNIVAVGISNMDISRAVNLIIENKGGLAVVGEMVNEILPLPVAGLMSDDEGPIVAEKYQHLAEMAKELGSELKDPFMTMSFMSLLVIPKLKISDRGLFDGDQFKPTSLFTE